MSTFFIFSCLLNAIASFLLGFFVLLKNRKNTLNISWFFTCLSIGLWALGLFFVVFSQDINTSLFWLKIHYLGAFFIPSCFLFFIFSFFEKLRGNKLSLIIAFFLSLMFFIVNFLGLISQGVSYKFFGFLYTDGGPLFTLFIIEYFIVATIAHLFALKNYNSLNEKKRNQLILILCGSVIGFLGGGTTIFPVYNWPIYPFGTPFVIFYTVLVTFAITKAHLMDITVIIGRTAAYAITIILFGVGYLLLTLSYVNLFSSKINFGFLVMTIIYGILVGEFFQRVRFLVQTTAEKAFLKGKYDYRKVLAKASKSLSNCHNLDDIAQVVESTFKDEMDVAGAMVVIFKG